MTSDKEGLFLVACLERKASAEDLERYADEVSAQLQRLYILSTDRLERQLHACGLTIAQYLALAAIVAFDKDVAMSVVAQAIKARPSSLTSIATRLESMGLVVRGRVSNDRRAVVVRATDAGISLAETIREQQRSELIRVLGGMPPDMAAALAVHLTEFGDAMQKASQ